MAKIDLKSGTVKLEGGDVATIALMAGLLAAIEPPEEDITPADCAKAATTLYREVAKEIFLTNQIPADEAALDLMVEVWAALPESNTEVPLGEDLTQRLAAFLYSHGRLDGEAMDPEATPEEQGRPKSLGLDSHFNDTSRRGHGR